jgi:hypothetical protein
LRTSWSSSHAVPTGTLLATRAYGLMLLLTR